jgi:glycosyltransferase involved in cell wall biosynthesis
MKVALCSSFVPFINGGARFIVDWLAAELQKRGHQTETIWLPFVENPDTMFRQMMAYRMIDLAQTADKLIAFRPPAYVIPHPNKTLWFIHHFRVFYDLWESPHCKIETNPQTTAFRNRLIDADTTAIGEAKRVFTNSRVVADRLQRFNGIEGEVLYPPIYKPERYWAGPYGDEIVCVCRVEPHKRQELLLEAMRFTRSGVKLRLCGLSHDGKYAKKLRKLVLRYKLQDKVIIDHRWISEEEKVEILARALAVAYAPVDEDSYGYPTLEGAHAERPIVTTHDAGGTLEFVEDSVNGFICDPTPESLGFAFDALFEDRHRTVRLGRAARARIDGLRIDWSHVVESVLA